MEVRVGRRGVLGFEEVFCLFWVVGRGRVVCVIRYCSGGLVREVL